jgi:hypothetical protein
MDSLDRRGELKAPPSKSVRFTERAEGFTDLQADALVSFLELQSGRCRDLARAYKIPAGQYEAIYSGMPARGLGKISQLLAAEGARETARGRIGA